MLNALSQLPFEQYNQFLAAARLSAAAKQILAPNTNAATFLQQLNDAKLYLDTLRVMVHCLQPEIAIDWVSQCLQCCTQQHSSADSSIKQLVGQWLQQPSEDIRQKLQLAAEQAQLQSDWSWLAMAIYWNGDSLLPANQPKVAPNSVLSHCALEVALTLAVTQPNAASELALQFYHLANNLQLTART